MDPVTLRCTYKHPEVRVSGLDAGNARSLAAGQTLNVGRFTKRNDVVVECSGRTVLGGHRGSLAIDHRSDGTIVVRHNASNHSMVVTTAEGSVFIDGIGPLHHALKNCRDATIDLYSPSGYGALRFELGAGASSALHALDLEIVVVGTNRIPIRVPAPADRPAILLETCAPAVSRDSTAVERLCWLSMDARVLAQVQGPLVVSGVESLLTQGLDRVIEGELLCEAGSEPSFLGMTDPRTLPREALPWREAGLVVIGDASPFDASGYATACARLVPPTLWLKADGSELADRLGERATSSLLFIIAGAPVGWLILPSDTDSPLAELLAPR